MIDTYIVFIDYIVFTEYIDATTKPPNTTALPDLPDLTGRTAVGTAAGSPVRALAAHPGHATTGLQRHDRSPGRRILMRAMNRIVGQDGTAGAAKTLYAATQDLPGASYVGPDGLGEQRGAPTLVGRSAAAGDPDTARRLWTVSEELTGVPFPERLRTPRTHA